MSGVIANRLRNTLDTIISNTQTGFLSGRQISDNTRLIYDLMHIAEKKKLTGMLMLIKGRLFVYGRPSGSAGSAFCFPYNSVTVRRILFKFGRFRQ